MERYLKIIRAPIKELKPYEGQIVVLNKIKGSRDLYQALTMDGKKYVGHFDIKFPILGCAEVKLNRLQIKLVKITRGKNHGKVH